jgi:hypothetical protein
VATVHALRPPGGIRDEVSAAEHHPQGYLQPLVGPLGGIVAQVSVEPSRETEIGAAALPEGSARAEAVAVLLRRAGERLTWGEPVLSDSVRASERFAFDRGRSSVDISRAMPSLISEMQIGAWFNAGWRGRLARRLLVHVPRLATLARAVVKGPEVMTLSLDVWFWAGVRAQATPEEWRRLTRSSSPFTTCPAPFAQLPEAVRSHAYEHSDLGGFAGRRVAVIGAGQSALECAALLHEAGAVPEVLAPAESIYWLGDGNDAPAPATRWRALPISPPPTDVGGRVTGWIAAAPDVFRHVPESLQPTVSFRCIRPAASGWLASRLAEVPISCGAAVVDATERDGAVRLDLIDGSSRTVDHVLLGTGYTVDVRRYPSWTADWLQSSSWRAATRCSVPASSPRSPGCTSWARRRRAASGR